MAASIPFHTDRGSRNSAMRAMADAIILAGGTVAGISKGAGESEPNWFKFLDDLIVGANGLGGTQLPRYTSLDYGAWQSVMDAIAQKVGVLGTVPQNILNPQIIPPPGTRRATGKAEVGEVLTCHKGEWAGNPGFAYEWWRNGVKIAGATSPRYTVVAADKGTSLVCRVLATNEIGTAYEDTDFYDIPAGENEANPGNFYLQLNVEQPPVVIIGVLQKVTLPLPVTPDNYLMTRVKMYNPAGVEQPIHAATLSWSSADPAIIAVTDEDTPNQSLRILKTGVVKVKCKNDEYQIERVIEFTVVDSYKPPAGPIADIRLAFAMEGGQSPPLVVGNPVTATAHFIDANGVPTAPPPAAEIAWWGSSESIQRTPSADKTTCLLTPIAADPTGWLKVELTTNEAINAETGDVLVIDPAAALGPEPNRIELTQSAETLTAVGQQCHMTLKFFQDNVEVPAPGTTTWTMKNANGVLQSAAISDSERMYVAAKEGQESIVVTNSGMTVESKPVNVFIAVNEETIDPLQGMSVVLKVENNTLPQLVVGGTFNVVAEYRKAGAVVAAPPGYNHAWRSGPSSQSSVIFFGPESDVTFCKIEGNKTGWGTAQYLCPNDGTGIIAELQIFVVAAEDAPEVEVDPTRRSNPRGK